MPKSKGSSRSRPSRRNDGRISRSIKTLSKPWPGAAKKNAKAKDGKPEVSRDATKSEQVTTPTENLERVPTGRFRKLRDRWRRRTDQSSEPAVSEPTGTDPDSFDGDDSGWPGAKWYQANDGEWVTLLADESSDAEAFDGDDTGFPGADWYHDNHGSKESNSAAGEGIDNGNEGNQAMTTPAATPHHEATELVRRPHELTAEEERRINLEAAQRADDAVREKLATAQHYDDQVQAITSDSDSLMKDEVPGLMRAADAARADAARYQGTADAYRDHANMVAQRASA